MLIDEFLPEYDFIETHDITIHADAARVYRVTNEIDFSESFIVRWLMCLRGMSGGSLTLRDLKRYKFEMLREAVNRKWPSDSSADSGRSAAD